MRDRSSTMGPAPPAGSDAAECYRAVFEQAAVGIARVGTDGRFLEVNDRFCEIAGYSRAQLMAGDFQHITHPDDLELDLENVRRLLAGEASSYMMEKRYLRPDGGVVWVALCVQEAVNNAIRHGQASHVRVEVTRDATHLTLTIRDDGCGFDPDALSSGDPGSLGLLSMRERAELLGGEFRLHGVVGSGVAIEARLPLREDSIAGPA